MRRDAARAEDFARRHGVPRWHTDADAILEAPDIDAVYIATLPDTHRDYAERAAAAGKAVYVEKPMAMKAAECDAMIAACAAAGVPLWVGYYRRALPRFLAVRDLLREGAIGEVREVVSTQMQRAPDPRAPGAWRRDAARAGGGPFFERRRAYARPPRFPVRPDGGRRVDRTGRRRRLPTRGSRRRALPVRERRRARHCLG
jgi:predicted dehydrogenase